MALTWTCDGCGQHFDTHREGLQPPTYAVILFHRTYEACSFQCVRRLFYALTYQPVEGEY